MLKPHKNNNPHPAQLFNVSSLQAGQTLSRNTVHISIISEKTDTEIKKNKTTQMHMLNDV